MVAKRLLAEEAVRYETPPRAPDADRFRREVDLARRRPHQGHLHVAVLGYARRIFVRASLSHHQDAWRESLANAFLTFGGVTCKLLIDRAGALVVGEDRETGTARVHPVFAGFRKAGRGRSPHAGRIARAARATRSPVPAT
ncbi:MAG: hypothetical protein ABI678_04420 [Kofleriaceae bacterium]